MRSRFAAIALAVLFGAQLATAQAAKPKPKPAEGVLGRNLLKNGNLEAIASNSAKPPGWAPVDGMNEDSYGHESGEWDWGLTGCPTCGKQYLRLTFDGTKTELSTSQTVDVSAAADKTDAGKVTADASAMLGGFHGADTTSTLDLSFQDATGKELGKLSTKPVDMNSLPKASAGDCGLSPAEAKGPLPAGTRKIVFTWHGRQNGPSGSYLALGDNFSLVLTAE